MAVTIPETSAAKGVKEPERAPGMRRSKTAVVADQGVRFVDGIVSNELNWLFREQPLRDYGIDAQVEVVTDDDLVTGRLIGLQIKSGDSQFVEAKDGEGWVFRDHSDHLAYWLGHSLPVVVVVVDTGGRAYWHVISTETVTETEKGFWITIPQSQPLDVTARDRLIELAGRSEGLLASLPTYYNRLPQDALKPLRRAEQVDRLAAARLAERLANGRDTPGMTAASLSAAKPSWLATSKAAQDLWMAVGGYAVEHGQDSEAGGAFELAADSVGPRSARARAFAGLSLLFIDLEAAGRLLRRARDEGQHLLADVGLSSLDIPEGDARAFNIPQSMLDATDDELNAEPTVLNFLGEMALRRGDLNAAVDYRERAAERSGPAGGSAQLALAETIWRRTSAEGGRSPRELRRALRHAQGAVEERRRWDGPSAAALAILLDIHIAAGQGDEAVKAALPASEGGTARDVEATSEPVASRGAFAALASGNKAPYEFFIQALPDGPRRHELEALQADDTDQSAQERIAIWTAVLNEAADDQMAVRCISRLVNKGVWPPQADELYERSIIPQDMAEMFKAVHQAKSGELDLGIAALRELAEGSPMAAYQLVQLLEDDVGAERAIQECERQVTRWRNSDLNLMLMDLLRRHGHLDRAADLIERSVADESLPVEVRLSLCRWYVSYKAMNGDFSDAATIAQSGLDIANDPDLAWNLVAALFHDGKVTQARDALARHRPEPNSQQEIRLWMQLHLGVPLIPDDARVMVDLAHRQPTGELRTAIIGHLVREVLLTPRPGDRPYPKNLVEAVRHLSDGIEHGPGPGVRLITNDDDALRNALEQEDVDPVAFQELIASVRRGTASLADVAQTTGRPYGAALLQRPAGALFAADLDPAIRSAGERAAETALDADTCVVDLSSVHLINLLADADRRRVRALAPHLTVASAAVYDAVRTRDSMRSLAIATYTVSLNPDGNIERTTLTPAQRSVLRQQAEALEAVASSLDVAEARSPEGQSPSDETLALARETRAPLWCDDIALRQTARQRGITTFCLLDLVTVLTQRGNSLGQAEIRRRLAEQYIVDLPLTADDVIAVAASHDWSSGPAHTALGRSSWWEHHAIDWPDSWLQIASSAADHSSEAVVDITKAALTGAIDAVSPGRGTERYQQLVVLTLVGCHLASKSAPVGLLDELARHAMPGLPPRAPFVLNALVGELERRSVPDPYLVARQLLPGVDLP